MTHGGLEEVELREEGSSQADVFFQTALDIFRRAESCFSGPSACHYVIGGYRVCLRFAGPALLPLLTPALAHLRSDPVPNPDLTIHCWDSVSTRVPMPPPPWDKGDYFVRGEIKGFNGDRIRTTFNLGSGVLNVLNQESNNALYWIRDAQDLPYYESGAPLITILNWWMGRHGRQLVHGGAIGTPEGGVLLVGRGGSGKSSTALASLNSELLYASDDYCLLSTDPEPYVHSIYCTGKVNAEDRALFPFLAPALSNNGRLDTEKALFFLHGTFPGKIALGFPLRAILLPRVTGLSETTLSRITPSASLMALAPSTIFQLPGAGRETFSTLGTLVRQLPSYVLNVGTIRSKIPHVILSLLRNTIL